MVAYANVTGEWMVMLVELYVARMSTILSQSTVQLYIDFIFTKKIDKCRKNNYFIQVARFYSRINEI